MIRSTVKKMVRTVAVEVGALDKNNKDVVQLMKIERAFKRAYKINKTVRYVDVKAKEFITRPGVNGLHNSKEIIVFINGDVRRNAETLLHELTHAYQAQHMTSMFNSSRHMKHSGKVSYTDSWHEVHARHCASLLINTLDFSLDLRNAFDYSLAA